MPLASANITASGSLVTGDSDIKVRALHWRDAGASTGSVVLRDGGSGGTVKTTINTDANSGEHVLSFQPGYIHFTASDTYAALTNVDSLTIWYDE